MPKKTPPNRRSGTLAAATAEAVVETHTLTVTAPNQNFAAYVTWDYNGDVATTVDRDLALRLTLPSGRVHLEDNDPNAGEALWEYAPLELGEWKLEVVNQGGDSFNYDLLFGFG